MAGGSFFYEELGQKSLKGIAQPTHCYRIVGVSEVASRFDAAHGEAGLTPLVGREQEIALLLDRWQQSQGGEGQVILLSGEPGIGKSRILSVLREQAEAKGAQALRLQCSPYYVNSALWPSIDHFERALKFKRDEQPESKLDKLEALIVTHYGRPIADARFVASMLSIPCGQRYGALAMTPQKHKEETLRTLVDLTESAARKQPSVMLFEDAHWADPTTLEMLELLIDRARKMPLLIVLTHRPEFQPNWGSHGHVIALNLSKLTPPQCSVIVSNLTGGKALPGDLLEQIITKTDGVPLYVEELTKSIIESGELANAGDHYEYSGTSRSITIPATLRDSLTARLDRFMPVKEIAQIAAAIGREFSYELLAAVSTRSKRELDQTLTQFIESGLAFRRGSIPHAVYTFKHALVQDAAYDSLLKSRRVPLHAHIAQALEKAFPDTVANQPEVVAHHYTAAEMPVQAVGYWKRAGELAHTRIALHEAIAHFEQGLAQALAIPSPPVRDRYALELHGMLGMAWLALQGWAHPAVAEHLEHAYALEEALTPGQHSLRVLWGLWVYRLGSGRTRQSLPMAEKLLSQAQLSGDEEMLQAGLWAVVTTYYWLGQFEKSIEYADVIINQYDLARHRHLADALNHDPKTVALQYKAASLGQLGYADKAAVLMHETLEHARARGHAFDHAWALYFAMAELYAYQRAAATIETLLAEFEPLVREQRLLVFEQMLGPYCGAIRDLLREKPENAEQALRELTPGCEAAQLGQVLCAMKTFRAQAALRTCQPDLPLILVDEVLAQIMDPGCDLGYLQAEVLRVKGLALQAKGIFDDAETFFRSAIELARSQKAKWWELRTSTSLAKLWQSQGKHQEAYDLLAPVYNWFTEGFDTRDLNDAKALLDELS